MFNRYTCLLEACRHLTLKLFIQVHPQSAKVPEVADFNSAYISLIIGPMGNHGLGIFYVVRFYLRPLLQGPTRIAKLKSAYNSPIILALEVWSVKATNRKSWAVNHLM